MAGVLVGLLIAIAVTRGMESMLYGVSRTDAVSFTIAVISVVAIAALASYLPARRAAGIDPSVTLRAE